MIFLVVSQCGRVNKRHSRMLLCLTEERRMIEPWLKKSKEEAQKLAKMTIEELKEISQKHEIEFYWIYEQFQKELQRLRGKEE